MENIVQGVRLDATGFPIGYRFRMAIAGMESEVEVRARDGYGRPQVVHVFDGAPGQVRGITPLAPALLVVRQFDQLANATLTAALVQAIFAATIESAAPTDQVLNALRDDDEQGVGAPSMSGLLTAKADWYESTKIDLGNAGKISHLFPGENLKMNRSEHPNSTYEAFAKFLLREIARCIGITFEQLTGDYSGATYSSVRMATSEVWQIVQYRRKNICGRFLQPIFEAWLEEEIEAARVPFPGGLPAFVQYRAAAARCDWRGPAKPQADDLKTAKAHETWSKLGVLPMEVICAELGLDWEDTLEQLAREKAARERLGLDEPNVKPDPAADKILADDEKAAA
jgi:lambda family phage portal protein